MNLRALRIFRQVVVTGSLADASRQLNISPSAASRLLSLLEAELKLTLFSRDRRRLVLTEEGDRFYLQTEHILRGLDGMAQLAADIRTPGHDRIHLVTAAPLAIGLVSPALALLDSRESPLDCRINVGTRFDLESRVASRAYNIGILSLPIENGILDLQIEPFLQSRLGVLMRDDHPLARLKSVTVADLEPWPFVTLSKGQRWRERLDEVFSSTGLVPRLRLETTATPVVKTLVQDGLGLAVTDLVCARIRPGEPLVIRPLTPLRWITYATIHPRGPRPRHSARLVEAMREVTSTGARDLGLSELLRLT